MFRQFEALRLVVRTDAGAVKLVRSRQHLLVGQTADNLAVFEDERHFARAHFQHRARAQAARAGIAEAGVEEAGVVDAEFAHQRVERHHLGGVVRRDLDGLPRRQNIELAGVEDQAAVAARADRSLFLDPDEFYILASTEAVQVPPDYAAEMVPFDPLVGEFRVHYAGFFDPGFGYAGAGGLGSRAVLEVRSREVPFILEHGQIVGRLVYEKMLARPDRLYGSGIGSNYQAQGLKLSKHFRG